MPLPVSTETARTTTATRDLVTYGATSMAPANSVNRPRTLEMRGPGGGSSVPPCRAGVTVPTRSGGGRVADVRDDDGVRADGQGGVVPHHALRVVPASAPSR